MHRNSNTVWTKDDDDLNVTSCKLGMENAHKKKVGSQQSVDFREKRNKGIFGCFKQFNWSQEEYKHTKKEN